KRVVEAIERFQESKAIFDRQHHDDIALLNWLLEGGLLDVPATSAGSRVHDSLAEAINRYHALEASLPAPQRAAAIVDGSGEDEFIFLRGNWRTPGEGAPRDVPAVFQVGGACSD